MWLVIHDRMPIHDLDGNNFEFETERDARLVARVLEEYCYERCEVIEA